MLPTTTARAPTTMLLTTAVRLPTTPPTAVPLITTTPIES